MNEKFYRTKEGKLVFVAIPGIGVDHAHPCSDMHGYQKNGFPTTTPSKIDDDNVWMSFSNANQTLVTACN